MDLEQQHIIQELQRANLELLHAYDATIAGWMRALELKDIHTGHHTLRVTELSLILARTVGIEDDKLIHLRRGATLHDIGKIGIPDAILNKPGPLTEAELALMKLHPQFGYDMLAPIDFLQPALDIVYCHHENWDGSGFPRGLKGGDIPLVVRIVAICNTWDTLVSDKPSHPGLGKQDALNHIVEGTGVQFDPEIVEAFKRLISHEN